MIAMNMKKNFSCILMVVVLMVAASSTLRAQELLYDDDDLLQHEVAVHFAKPGVSALPFDGIAAWGSPHSNGSFGMAVAYTYWFTRHIGITSGLHFTYFSFAEELDDIYSTARGSIDVISSDRRPMSVATTMSVNTPKAIEEQSILMFDIPVFLTLQHKHLFTNIGFGFATPLSMYGSYAYDASSYYITAVDGLGIRFRKPVLAEVEEGNEGNYDPSDVKHPFFFELAADLGWKFPFDNRNVLSFSLFARYSLNKCKVDDSGFDIIDISNSVSSTRSPMQAGLVDSYRYYAVGISITYHWGFGKVVRE